jgi:RNA polymerase sigma factor (sigma-70 family)
MTSDKKRPTLTLINNTPKSVRLLSEEAKEKIILRSRTKARKLAKSLLRRWNARLDINEIDSIVDLSLCEAASRFSPEVGASFMTFLFYHLRGNLIRTISVAANANTVPLLDGDSSDDLDIAGGSFTQSYEIANAVTGTEAVRPDEALIRNEMIKLSSAAKDRLDTLAKQVLDRVFVDEEQLIDIAYDLGYSRCHISRVKRRALEAVYEDLSSKLDLEAHERPDFDDEDISAKRKRKAEVHRRQPRSAAALQGRKKVA